MENKKPVLPILICIVLVLAGLLNGYCEYETYRYALGYMDQMACIQLIVTYVLYSLVPVCLGLVTLLSSKHRLAGVGAFVCVLLQVLVIVVTIVFGVIRNGSSAFNGLKWYDYTLYGLFLVALILLIIQNPFKKEGGQSSGKGPKEKKNNKDDATITPEELQEAEDLYAAGVLSDEEIEEMRNKAA